MRLLSLVLILFMVSGCIKNYLGKITFANISGEAPTVTSVTIVNDQVIVTGTNLTEVNSAQVQGTLNHTFDIESKSETQIVLNAKSAIGFLIGGTFDLFIGNAYGAATFPISFDLADGQVTSTKIYNMGAGAGQVLTFNGTNWVPGTASGSQVYSGTYNATTNAPDVVTLGGPAGTFYIVTVAGTQDLGTGNITFAVGDWVIYDGTDWSKVPLSSASVSSFNGRLGAVVPLADDYTWDMLDKTGTKIAGSSVAEIEDVDVTGLANNDVLVWNSGTLKWEAKEAPLLGPATGNVQLGANYLNNDGGTEGVSVDTSGNTSVTTTNATVAPAMTLANTSTAVGAGNSLTLKNGAVNQTELKQEISSANNSSFSISTLTSGTLTEKIKILASGFFGIGTSTPAAKLDVAGEVKVGTTTGLACSATTKGSIRYNDVSNIMEYCNGTAWSVLQAAACSDAIPSVLAFNNEANGTISTLYTSNIVQITGINCIVAVTVSGNGSPQFQICSDAACATPTQTWTSSPSSASSGQYIQMRLTSDASGGVSNDAYLVTGSLATTWSVVTTGSCAGSPAVGTVCADGTVYAGLSADGSVPMYTQRCDYGMTWNGSVCTGSRASVAWNNGTTNYILENLTNASTGRANTTALAALADAASPHTAAIDCEALNENGYTDWYLPSRNELGTLYSNSGAIRNFSTGVTYYWSSTENGNNGAWAQRFSDGFQNTYNKTGSFFIRCVRRS